MQSTIDTGLYALTIVGALVLTWYMVEWRRKP